MDPKEWRHMLTGATGDIKVKDNPTTWIDDNTWISIYKQFSGLSHLPGLENVEEVFMNNIEDFKIIYDSANAHTERIPIIHDNLTEF
jgi:hypothetical protein